MNAHELELFYRLEVDLAHIRELGSGRAGKRRIIPIIGAAPRVLMCRVVF